MTSIPKKKAGNKKTPKAELSSKTIAEQTKAFLKAGGNIDHIKRGVTGYNHLEGRKHIVLGPKRDK